MDDREIVCLSSDGDDDESGKVGDEAEENASFSDPSTRRSDTGASEIGSLPVDDSDIGLSSSQAPLCRKFWKAGNFYNGLHYKPDTQRAANNYLHVHPMFLHSNATSHKWVFGAIAELLDNAFDEIQQGATYVMVDRISNPKDGSPALLIKDDGSGMDPEAMRRFMSFGFSDKKSNFAVGQYGNGFKTGSMRLGADAIVFSCHQNDMAYTLSIGLLSYTFLTRAQLDRIVVPMVSYIYNTSAGSWDILKGQEQFTSNLSLMLKWSPFQSEAELIEQLTNIGYHGTKIIIFNLWFNDDENLELDFDTDPEDIRIAGDIKKINTTPGKKKPTATEQHIASRFHYSLRDYLSILYLRVPECFRIILRGEVVKLHSIADDLKHTDIVLYRPKCAGSEEAIFVTTIGFLKEAPKVDIHGFNIYHKNRLILVIVANRDPGHEKPFWPVVSYLKNRGGGVVGILRADFIEPTHNKQDFERTSLFQKLEIRLKEMTWEYWDHHCHLIGYQKKDHSDSSMQQQPVIEKAVALDNSSVPVPISFTENGSNQSNLGEKLDSFTSGSASLTKRKRGESTDHHKMKPQGKDKNVRGPGSNQETTASPVDQEVLNLLETNKNLNAQLSAHEKRDEELNLEVTELKSKIEEAKLEYNRLLEEALSLDLGFD